ncbi:ead/Ea22-like family protein [Salmonella enterica subsp. enterica serovar Mountpleasant]|nr:ead/Ea22-like family protein [Salmonella enterica subsp. enterica serovar Mountpleasant]
MMNTVKQALLKAAQKVSAAGCGNWSREASCDLSNPGSCFVIIEGSDAIFCINRAVGGSENAKAVLEFIAAANPNTVLALLDELEVAGKRMAELENRNSRLINERNEAGVVLAEMERREITQLTEAKLLGASELIKNFNNILSIHGKHIVGFDDECTLTVREVREALQHASQIHREDVEALQQEGTNGL